jgi:hypothetical protein
MLYRLIYFFFVAETDKISNLKLVDDISGILKFIESEVSGIEVIDACFIKKRTYTYP